MVAQSPELMEIILPLKKKKGNLQKYLEMFSMLFITSQVILFSVIEEEEQGRQKQHLLECGWWGNNTGAVICGCDFNAPPKMSHGEFECDTVVTEYMFMIL